ncbi:tetratricopeptide repeat protein [Candidatus Poribacteria bacterium]|nr:tetratricopeptide repeat protein [Candidatus Poribacteria bacterium]
MTMEANLREFLRTHPDDPMVLVSLGTICLRDRRLQEARDLLEHAVASDPAYMAAYPLLGECWEGLGDAERARSAYSEALMLAERTGDRTMAAEMRDRIEALDDDL